ncbi:2-C-methyl-D-erythritol 4-phosphate cytidylyltransferase [Chitinophaga polysaccharea]|uniref:2-C-methyl-D-erythritol 4-phosphate cytidylyltransferase n=1 Tax=Chitinophaga TaxID=79328 RepID=UPI0014552CA9|nr:MULTISPECIES: 2-C-methyl-D-erythritol 4-phosphate cytidylyltransferase [Chitinophaga]NLR60977.1 2-C-methyl-D-erythritol 4-phosphate cytidylyltransferase [Chitinophaga polysaccharea]NLU94649.1 2-C-methyl-D-erythritol 4-phosphate cytidylyltransferase [Chitinophaga sp. Ak27]
MEYKKVAIIVAGGSGTRMQSAVPKQFLELAGKPVLYHTIAAFAAAYTDMEIVLVLPEAHFSFANQLLQAFDPLPAVTIVKGGETRFHSVKNGLQLVNSPSVVFVHDGVRPLVSTALIRACYEAALNHGTAIPVVDMKDSIREIRAGNNAAVDRDRFKIIQTPQTFLSHLILPAFELPYDPLFTDEATVVERLGHPVHLLPGEESNIKITKPLDLTIAEALLKERH